MTELEQKLKKVTRLTVVDHKNGIGRVIEVWDVKLELDFQDEGRTLKVFIN